MKPEIIAKIVAIIKNRDYGRMEEIHLKLMLREDNWNVNMKDASGFAALHWAMQKDKANLVRILLSRQETELDITNTEYQCWTPLHMACHSDAATVIPLYCKDVRCTPELLNKRDDHGDSPLMLAVKSGSLDCVRQLAKVAGVEWNITDHRSGHSLVQVALDLNLPDMCVFITLEIDRRQERESRPAERRSREGAAPFGERPAQKPRLQPEAVEVRVEETSTIAEMAVKLGIELGEIHNKICSLKAQLDHLEKATEKRENHFNKEQNEKWNTFGLQQISKSIEFEEKQKAEKADFEKEQHLAQQSFEMKKEKEKEQFDALYGEDQNEILRKKKLLKEYEKMANEKKGKLKSGLDCSPQSQLIPECPICLDPMAAPAQIFSCMNGHNICGTCKPRVKTCATCRSGEYICRNIAVEQMVRGLMKIE